MKRKMNQTSSIG